MFGLSVWYNLFNLYCITLLYNTQNRWHTLFNCTHYIHYHSYIHHHYVVFVRQAGKSAK